jgi:hypothetical protein
MANVADHKTVNVWSNEGCQLVKVEYDFDNDAGTAGALGLLTTDEDIVIHDFWAKGVTVLDSAADGSSIDVGISGGDTNILLDGVAEATFAAGALIKPTIVEGAPNVIPMPLKLAADGTIVMEIVDEDLTSGKCEFHFLISKF